MENLNIRYSDIKDYKYLLKWLQHKENNQWFGFSEKKDIENSAKNWIGFSKFKASLTAEINSEVCAIGTLFLMPYQKLRHLCMFYLIVDEKYRRKKIGTKMMKNLINLAQNYFKLESIFAEVYEGCQIIPLLKNFNFNQVAYQKMYVRDNVDKNKFSARLLFDLWFK